MSGDRLYLYDAKDEADKNTETFNGVETRIKRVVAPGEKRVDMFGQQLWKYIFFAAEVLTGAQFRAAAGFCNISS
nr:hypothetical protein [Thalassococcus sp. S3]